MWCARKDVQRNAIRGSIIQGYTSWLSSIEKGERGELSDIELNFLGNTIDSFVYIFFNSEKPSVFGSVKYSLLLLLLLLLLLSSFKCVAI